MAVSDSNLLGGIRLQKGTLPHNQSFGLVTTCYGHLLCPVMAIFEVALVFGMASTSRPVFKYVRLDSRSVSFSCFFLYQEGREDGAKAMSVQWVKTRKDFLERELLPKVASLSTSSKYSQSLGGGVIEGNCLFSKGRSPAVPKASGPFHIPGADDEEMGSSC